MTTARPITDLDLRWMRRALELQRRGKNRRNHAASRAIFTRRLLMTLARS